MYGDPLPNCKSANIFTIAIWTPTTLLIPTNIFGYTVHTECAHKW